MPPGRFSSSTGASVSPMGSDGCTIDDSVSPVLSDARGLLKSRVGQFGSPPSHLAKPADGTVVGIAASRQLLASHADYAGEAGRPGQSSLSVLPSSQFQCWGFSCTYPCLSLTTRVAQLHLYIYTRVHTYIHTYMHACIHTYIHTYIHSSEGFFAFVLHAARRECKRSWRLARCLKLSWTRGSPIVRASMPLWSPGWWNRVWSRRPPDPGLVQVGVFVVAKKSGAQRLVVDERLANCHSSELASTALPLCLPAPPSVRYARTPA